MPSVQREFPSQAIEQQVKELQDKLKYHQEINNAQRVMLEDALNYCKQLEQKLENIDVVQNEFVGKNSKVFLNATFMC